MTKDKKLINIQCICVVYISIYNLYKTVKKCEYITINVFYIYEILWNICILIYFQI